LGGQEVPLTGGVGFIGSRMRTEFCCRDATAAGLEGEIEWFRASGFRVRVTA
jgi:hypothetical protein